MATFQGLAFFDGVRSLLGATMTLSLGTSPSICTLTVPPQPGRFLLSGTLTFVYGPVRFAFPNARVDTVDIITGADGTQRWVLRIMDRRWVWRETGQISGFYNVRRDTNKVVPGTEKRPQELAKLCLEAMGERGYDVSALPNDVFPEIDWDYTNPAEALSRLCDQLGCTVALGLDNRVRIVRLGVGAALPFNGLSTEGNVTADPPDPPGELVIVGARDKWQADLALEPVGLDVDGKIKPIGKLSYVPRVRGRKTWRYSDIDHFLDVRNVNARGLAQQSVFKWYRIKTPFTLPGRAERIKELDRILPLLTTQVETVRTDDGREEPRAPWVYGRFWDGFESHEPREKHDNEHDVQNRPQGLYTKGFSLDTDLGIVKFSEPVYLMKLDNTVAAGRQVFPAKLFLRVGVNLRDKKTRAWIRTEYTRRPPGTKTFPTTKRFILREDIQREIWQKHTPPAKLEDNLQETEKAARHYLIAALREYEATQAGSITYAGLIPISPDGAIRQVTWTITEEGFAITRASRNREELLVTPSYEERRLYERLHQVLQERDKPERHRRADLQRRKG